MIIKETLLVLWTKLQPSEMPVPTKEIWLNTAERFYNTANFSNCLGAVDGKHIRLISPQHSGTDFFNYKKIFLLYLWRWLILIIVSWQWMLVHMVEKEIVIYLKDLP